MTEQNSDIQKEQASLPDTRSIGKIPIMIMLTMLVAITIYAGYKGIKTII